MNNVAKDGGQIKEAGAANETEPTSERVLRASPACAQEERHTVTLTVGLFALRALFAGGNRSSGTAKDADPLGMALDIIEHAAMELHTFHDALMSDENRIEELANHAWRLSAQLESGIELVNALKKAAGAE
jgi:hypothetical protein